MIRELHVKLASPRGFCAGVERAIRTVENALALHGAPVYVRHEIVHNAHVVARLKAMGAVFVDEIRGAPDGRPVIVSAHGAPRATHHAAKDRGMQLIDATCPLVQKVHAETRRQVMRGRHVILIGHRGHAEVEGTMGQAPAGAVTVIAAVEEVAAFEAPDAPLAYVTQTTLSVDDAAIVISALKARFPQIEGPKTADICYATSNRQAAVKAISPSCDLIVIIGSPSSSNSCRLVDVAKAAGAKRAILVDDPETFGFAAIEDASTLGISAGASAPGFLVETLLKRLASAFRLTIETVETAHENVAFKTPALLAG
jgi:4-hydroxy-3-methylbut-2-enyl diphosphate reductase